MDRLTTRARPGRPAAQSALLAVRLLVGALSLAGIFAMHGLSVTDVGGTHRGPIVLDATATGVHDNPDAHYVPGSTAAGSGAPALAPAADHAGHADMAGCVAILLGLIGLAALRLRRVGTRTGGPPASIRSTFTPSVARAPPQPIFLSLCVFRT